MAAVRTMKAMDEDEEGGAGLAQAGDGGCCVQCEDEAATGRCVTCGDIYCDMCFDILHRRGRRRLHKVTYFDPSHRPRDRRGSISDGGGGGSGGARGGESPGLLRSVSGGIASAVGRCFARGSGRAAAEAMAEGRIEDVGLELDPEELGRWFEERARYIPLRLSYEERKVLRLVKAVVGANAYTSRVDAPHLKPAKRKHMQMEHVCAILSGLVVASDYGEGEALVESRRFVDYAGFFRSCFEVARRHKVMNPEKMRTEYGKLVYFLQDAGDEESMADMLEFSPVMPVKTVYALLEAAGGLAVLKDPRIAVATREVADDKSKSRSQLQREIRAKNDAIRAIGSKYASRKLSRDDIELCLYSISDNNSFLGQAREPVQQMIDLLKRYFDPRDGDGDGDRDEGKARYSLAIAGGQDGSRLTHSHERQYNFVLQSLTLWRDIMNDMFKLWLLCEQDLLDVGANPYEQVDTGQGMHRLQQCPRTRRAMHRLLYETQQRVDRWVGSSVIHLGEKNVPNALMFIDKYTQIERILNPILLTLRHVDGWMKSKDKAVARYITKTFGGHEQARKDILFDFFKGAFDGGGASNFFDAGSCIDGRLTSAWNWCQKLPDKPYFPLFKLAGFTGFDGDFQE